MAAMNDGAATSYVYTTLDDDAGGDTNRDLQRVLRTIEEAAYAAGEVALSTSGKIAVKDTKVNARDLVTESDVECQRLIKEIILTEFPNDVFLGEEDVDLTSSDNSFASSGALRKALGIGSDDGNDDRLIFVVVSVREHVMDAMSLLYCHFRSHIIHKSSIAISYSMKDPIDGTTNFQAGLPLYAMSIGVVSLAGSTPDVVAGTIYNPVRNMHFRRLFCSSFIGELT